MSATSNPPITFQHSTLLTRVKRIITNIAGLGFHLPGDNIDTDRIIPARFLKCVTFDGLGESAFMDDRTAAKGEHPFDQEKNKGRPILLVDQSFGCGSSREHAVPAIAQNGVKAIIGLSFAEIFIGNATGNGVACVTLTEESDHEALRKACENDLSIDVNIETLKITILDESGNPFMVLPCTMPEAFRQKLITGNWDDIAICMEAEEQIEQVVGELHY